MHTTTEMQRRLIALKYLAPLDENGRPNDDGTFGSRSLDAYNHYRAAKGFGPVNGASMAQLDQDLFPEDYAHPVSNPLDNPIVRIGIGVLLSQLTKGKLPMLTTFDKAWVAGVVAFVCQYVINHFFNITISADTQSLIVTVIISLVTFAATWIVPNKPKA